MKRIIAGLLILTTWQVAEAQQDPLYNQYQFNQFMINPAYAGIHDRFSTALITRAQWAGIEGAPLTNTLTAQTSLLRGRMGTGLMLISDKFGVNENIEIQAAYSYIIDFITGKLSMGLQAGMIRNQYNYDALNLEYVDDEKIPPQQESFSKPNFGVGFMYMAERYYVGFSVPRILNIEIEDGVSQSVRYKKHYYLSGGVVLVPSAAFKIRFTSLVRYVENAPLSLDVNGSVLLGEALWVGLSMRNLSTVGLLASIDISDSFRLGYAFETPTNDLSQTSYGTHELTLSLDLTFFKGQQNTRRYF